MPYKTINDLPEVLRMRLPKKAQEIYRAIFNKAYDSYHQKPKRRISRERQELVASRIAWSAVKKEFHKANDHWVPGQSLKNESNDHK